MTPPLLATARRVAPVWEWRDRPGLESALLRIGSQSSHIEGIAVMVLEGHAGRLAYTVLLDEAGQVTDAQVSLKIGEGEQRVQLTRQVGAWSVDGAARPDLDACIDIDIMGSPSTNTLPIRRHQWAPGQARDFDMAYIRLPDLIVLSVRQRYTCLDATGRRFEYLSVASGFRAEISVDEHAIVTEYPPYWHRVR
jgi:uncharacterized protein